MRYHIMAEDLCPGDTIITALGSHHVMDVEADSLHNVVVTTSNGPNEPVVRRVHPSLPLEVER